MGLQWYGIAIDAREPLALARFWAGALGWGVTAVLDGEVFVEAPDGSAPALVCRRVTSPPAARSRVHLDLRSASRDAQDATVRRLVAAGARHADLGQGAVPWVVLTDPEGNDFCVLDPREVYEHTGSLAAVVVTCDDPPALASFWRAALAWEVDSSNAQGVALRAPDERGPFLEFVRAVDPVAGATENRAFILLTSPERDVEVGLHTDPEGNRYAVLPPSEPRPRE